MEIRKAKKAWSLILAIAVVFAMMPGLAMAESKVGSATVTVGACNFEKANQFDFVTQSLTVKGDTAEQFGLSDNGDTSKVTILDVITAVHAVKYGSAMTKDNVSDYLVCGSGGYFSKMFKIATSSLGYFVNAKITSTAANDTYLQNGDQVDFFKYQSPYWADIMTDFSQQTKTVTVGESFTIQLQGINGWKDNGTALENPINNEMDEDDEETAGTIQGSTVDPATGALTPIPDAVPDHDGSITFKFDKAGTYYVSASGEFYCKEMHMMCPITLPICKVTVTEAAAPAKPALPRPVIKAAGRSWTSIKVSWSKVKKADRYRVYRAASKQGRYKLVKTTKALRWTDTRKRAGKHYYYKVIASRAGYRSAVSKIDAAKAAAKAPKLTLTAGRHKIKVRWSRVKGADGYMVYRTAKKNGTFKALHKARGLCNQAYTSINKKTGKKYYYKVRAYKRVNGKVVYGLYSKVKVKAAR
ncbi:MAG: hypothetical protein ACOX4I_05535 [Anaerovoracaceae bacterium]|jgi:hypothetical protein